jgi:serine/threonine-protein kinase
MPAGIVNGRFEIVRLIGQGGMGEVFEARDQKTNERVALKLIRLEPSDALEDSESYRDRRRRFSREARILEAIVSPNVVRIVDAGHDPDTRQPFIAMEYLEGEDLNRLCDRLGAVPVDLALRIGVQVARGLSKVHDAGTIHRDVKPANIFLASTGAGGERIVKVVDFGVARAEVRPEHEVSRDATRTGGVVGSPSYMSPEQARGLKTIDARADVWSLGVVLYKLLTGKVPHPRGEGGVGDLLIAICCTPAKHIQDVAPWVPASVAKIVHRALRIDPDLRFSDANEMAKELASLVPGGVDIDDSMLAPLSEEERAIVAQRAFPDPSAFVGSEASTANDATRIEGTPRNKGRSSRRWIAAPVLLAAGLLVALVAARSRGVVAGSQASPAPPVVPMAPQVQAEEPVRDDITRSPVSVNVEVPKGAIVRVDGSEVPNPKGAVSITGLLGSAHAMEVTLHGTTKTVVVAITTNGPVPSSVTIAPVSALAPRRTANSPLSRAVAPASSAPSAPSATLNDKFE